MQNLSGNILHSDVLQLFMMLVRCGIGKATELPFTPDEQQWNQLYDFACKQALQGIAFAGVEKLPQHQRPSSALILNWYRNVVAIRANNKELTKNAILVSTKFADEGFANAILKGQGVAQYYPDPSLRVAGDIDIWLQGGCDNILRYVRKYIPNAHPTYHHVDFPIRKGLDIEIHYRPTWMYNPIHNARLQRYFVERECTEFKHSLSTAAGELHVPTVSFNLVFIPIHIYRHLFDEGIGMRQILDYYFVLQHSTVDERLECVRLFKRIGMLRFMRALMYVMQQMFGLDAEHMPVPPAAKDGNFLLNEIIESGNFGMYDARYQKSGRGYNMQHFKNQLKRSLMLFRYYPSETLWNPPFKLWHTLWRMRH